MVAAHWVILKAIWYQALIYERRFAQSLFRNWTLDALKSPLALDLT